MSSLGLITLSPDDLAFPLDLAESPPGDLVSSLGLITSSSPDDLVLPLDREVELDELALSLLLAALFPLSPEVPDAREDEALSPALTASVVVPAAVCPPVRGRHI